MSSLLRKIITINGKNVVSLRHSAPRARARACASRQHSLALLIVSMFSLPAPAAISDTIHPFLTTSISREDNLLRLPDAPSGADQDRSDTLKRIDGGLLFERPMGRQLLSGHAKFTKVTFNRYQQLDYQGKDVLAALNWQLGNHVQGHVGLSYVQALAPYTDFHAAERNLSLQRRDYLDATWRFHPSWQVRSGFTREQFRFDLAAQRFNDRIEDATEFGIDYLAPSSSRVGVQLRHMQGKYPQHAAFGAPDIGDAYTQDEAKANIYWAFSDITQLQFLGGWVRRQFAALRANSPVNGRVIVTWAPLGKVTFTATGWREFAAVDSTIVRNSLNKGASVGAAWNTSAKLRVEAQLKREKRDFSAISVSLADLADATRSATLGITYAPLRNVQLGVHAFRDVRAGSVAIGIGSYRANGLAFHASAQF